MPAPSTIDMAPQEAGADDQPRPRQQFTEWNEYDGPISTARFGLGLLVDFSAYLQDHESEQQVDPQNDVGIRDFRLLGSGRFKTERPLSWTIGYGETRGYNARGGYFEPISPDRTWLEGGPGAWEAVLHVSYIDLDDRDIEGGKLLRLTRMMNWYLSDNLRFEFAYGYSVLSRFDLDGHTHFFQGRLQLTL